MKVRILFFGATADLTGAHEIEIQTTEGSSAADVLENLAQRHPGLSGRKLLFAINEQYIGERTMLQNGDELAIFAPVSGG